MEAKSWISKWKQTMDGCSSKKKDTHRSKRRVSLRICTCMLLILSKRLLSLSSQFAFVFTPFKKRYITGIPQHRTAFSEEACILKWRRQTSQTVAPHPKIKKNDNLICSTTTMSKTRSSTTTSKKPEKKNLKTLPKMIYNFISILIKDMTYVDN